MSENLNRSEQDATEVSSILVTQDQNLLPSANSPYEDTPVPYISPQPSAPPPQTGLKPRVSDTEQDLSRIVFPEKKSGMVGCGTVVGGVLGAVVGGMVSIATGGNLLGWIVIGAFTGLAVSTFSDVERGEMFWYIFWRF